MTSKHPIPSAALDDRLGFTGTAGSGKTYNAGAAVERVLVRKGRVVIPDPLGVWWGLRVLADGKTPSPHNVVIFGGPHGDLPITEQAGALIGETVAGMAESCVLDLSQLGTKAAERRFMLAFLTAFYKHANGEPVHVVFDEADMWAPQRLLDRDGDAARLLGMMETIVRRGRVKGFIPWLITQRPAVLSKDVLSQVDGLITFKLTSSQDRDAIGAWVEGSADKQQWRDIWASLPTMERGQGVIWVPARGILATAHFPEKLTFDSSSTPKRGEAKRTAKLKPINLEKLEKRLATVKAEQDASNPKALRAEIAKLKAEAAKKPTVQTVVAADPKAIADAEARGRAVGKVEGFAEGVNEITAIWREMAGNVLSSLKFTSSTLETSDKKMQAVLERATKKHVKEAAKLAARQPGPPTGNGHFPAPAPTRTPPAPARAPSPAPAGGDGSISGPQQAILNSLATWQQLGHEKPSNAQVAWLAGYSPNSSSYKNPRSALKTAELISYPENDCVAITDAGRTAARPIALPGTFLDFVLGKLSGPEAAILKSIASHYPNAIDNATAASGANYSPTSSSYKNPRSAIRTKDLITYPQNDFVRAADWLFAA